jgi:NADPH:quinone reductase-like Zn-dependent oxidoreductase
MKAMQVNNAKQQPILIAAEIPEPQPGDDEVLIRVHAAGVTPTEVLWYPTTHTKEGTERKRAVPGHEFSGVIAASGKNVQGFSVGDDVYGMNDWFADGATAEFCITLPQNIARKPVNLSHEEAATVPIAALTAWQGLLDRAKIQAGERVLVHGGAGAVGLHAVQLAHLHGAHVIATASAQNIELLNQLGANEVIDYKVSRFEEEIKDVDVIFDTVGGETFDRSWGLLKPRGQMVTIAADSEGTADQRIKDAFFIVEPNQKQLVEAAKLVDEGRLKTFVKATVPFNQAADAYGILKNTRGYGKVVISVSV